MDQLILLNLSGSNNNFTGKALDCLIQMLSNLETLILTENDEKSFNFICIPQKLEIIVNGKSIRKEKDAFELLDKLNFLIQDNRKNIELMEEDEKINIVLRFANLIGLKKGFEKNVALGLKMG